MKTNVPDDVLEAIRIAVAYWRSIDPYDEDFITYLPLLEDWLDGLKLPPLPGTEEA
jgi:hypothetical protein